MWRSLRAAVTALAFITALTLMAEGSASPFPDIAQSPTNGQPAKIAWQAYTAALKLTDPDKKREALREVVKAYPGTPAATGATYQLMVLEVRNAREARTEALDQVKVFLADTGEEIRLSPMVRAAGVMLNEGVMLDEAEDMLVKGLRELDEKRYIAALRQRLVAQEAKERATNPQAKSPGVTDDASLAREFALTRQNALLMLGQVYLKRGMTTEGEQRLRDACAADPRTYLAGTAALKLSELAKAAGRDADELEYLTIAALDGRLTPETRSELESLYSRSHEGRLDGLEDMLDARYDKQTPRLHVERYVPAASRSQRVVLAEVFTGAGCPPCVNTDLAFDAAMERYSAGELAVLMYHLHVPSPDPLANPSTIARAAFYEDEGVPNAYIDGHPDDPDPWGFSSLSSVYGGLQRSIEPRLTIKPGVTLGGQAVADTQRVSVRVAVGETSLAGAHLHLHLALAERRVRYSGENGVRYHSMVVRRLAGETSAGLPLVRGKPATVRYTFDLGTIERETKAHLDELEQGNHQFPSFRFLVKKHQIDPRQLVVVAFVQEDDGKAVLQAVLLPVQRKAGTAH